ncbi:protein of unknown function [Candidatus Nitrotoga arctica]|uniref:Uncharacterized protein n=1 Tax=Candidatus Nitrotoga arctica TaxID=453162 RepID=A0ABM8YZS5_9PROT|nr:protein of unknown function [Candidatus Nitrotoga arctica]
MDTLKLRRQNNEIKVSIADFYIIFISRLRP